MIKEQRINKYIRQSEIINLDKLNKSSVTIIGVGSVGSFTALMLAKMGVGKITAYDEDGVQEHNLPGQFFDTEAIGDFKTEALAQLITDFAPETKYKGYNKFYKNQKLAETVIVATDNMEKSRWLVWEQFLKQEQCKNLIDARMGAELAKLYTITSKSKVTQKFYKGTLHTDAESAELSCTARTIIYNVLMISSLIGRAYKSIIQNEKFPKEVIFNMTQITPFSLMLRDK